MLPRGSVEARGRVTKRSRDNYGNPIGNYKPNPILYSRQYVVYFEDVIEAQLTSNAIDKIMYAQFYPDINQYLMLDYIIDLRRSTTSLCYADRNFVNNGLNYKLRSTADW